MILLTCGVNATHTWCAFVSYVHTYVRTSTYGRFGVFSFLDLARWDGRYILVHTREKMKRRYRPPSSWPSSFVSTKMDHTCMIPVVVFTLNRFLYPTSAVPPVSFLIIHPRDTNSVVTDSETDKNQTSLRIKVGKSSASVPGTRAKKKNATRELRATK